MRVSLLLFLFLACSVGAQEETGEQQDGPRFIKFLALGDFPPWREKLRGNVRVQVPPPAGSLPPREVFIPTGGLNKERLGLTLGSMTPYVELGAKQKKVQLFEQQKGEGNPWLNLNMPTSNQSLAVLVRDPKQAKPTWKTPLAKVLRNDLEAFPAETIRIVNVSKLSVAVKIGKEKSFLLKPGAVQVKKLAAGDTVIRVGAKKKGGGYRRFFANRVSLRKGHRINAFVYTADGVKPDQPAYFRFFPEVAIQPKPKKKRENVADR